MNELMSSAEHMEEPIETVEVPAVKIGSIVEVHFIEDPENVTEIYQITARHDEDENPSASRAISIASPFGKALLGTSAGDTVTYPVPGNAEMSVKIISIH